MTSHEESDYRSYDWADDAFAWTDALESRCWGLVGMRSRNASSIRHINPVGVEDALEQCVVQFTVALVEPQQERIAT